MINSTVQPDNLATSKYIDSDDFLLNSYIKNLKQKKVSLLNKEEEVKLVKQIRNGNREALVEFIESNLRLVIFVAKKHRYQGVPFIDLINEGNIALIKSLEKFNPEESKFSTYATFLIEKFILRDIQKHSRTVHLPEKRYKEWFSCQKKVETLTCKNTIPPSNEEVDLSLNKDPGWTANLKNLFSDELSLNHFAFEDSDATLIDSLSSADEFLFEPETAIEQVEYREIIVKLLDFLDQRSASVIKMYYGIECNQEYSQSEIASHLKVSQQRVYQIKVEALRTMSEMAKVLKIDVEF